MPKLSGKMLIDYPNLVKEWDYENNSELNINEIRAGTHKKVNWICPKGPDHKWKAFVYSRTAGQGCPYCSGKRASITNSLASLYPELVKQIDWEKETDLDPEKIVSRSSRKIHWKCPKGEDHKWTISPRNRIRGNIVRGCPYCANQKASITNNLESIEPELAKMWYYEKNNGLTPKDIIAGSNKKFWWKCPNGKDHIWYQTPNVIAINSKRHKGNGCPKCGRKQTADAKAKPKIGDSFGDSFPELVKDWHPKNKSSPYTYKIKSNKRVFWQCHKNSEHVWETTVANRANGNGCPYCSGSIASKDYNLLVEYPKVADEWHYEKNKELTPDKVTPISGKKVWWKCKSNPKHEWESLVSNRTGFHKTECPYCSIVPRSKSEIKLAFELKNFFDFDIDDHKIKIGNKLLDLDIKIPSLNLLIEFDGSFWHKDKIKTDLDKTRKLENIGWKVIRIREEPLEIITSNDFVVKQNCPAKEVMNLLLPKIEQICNIQIKGLDNYLNLRDAVNEKSATQYISQLLKDKNQTTLM